MSPREHAARSEAHPRLPDGTEERVSGYGVMGVPFASGHVLGLRRWTASSVGEPFTSIWHRNPTGTWRFLETMVSERGCEVACSRWFGSSQTESIGTRITLDWTSPAELRVTTADGEVDWRLTFDSTPVTQLMTAMGTVMPARAWKSEKLLRVMGTMATKLLGQGQLGLVGSTPMGYRFIANPYRLWRVDSSTASIDGVDVGPLAPLANQSRVGDFWIPQRGIFAMGRVFMWK